MYGLRATMLKSEQHIPVPEEVAPGADESQRSDASVLTLEKNSYNFLEYVSRASVDEQTN